MIFITHDMGIVANLCDRVIVMYAGRIVEKAETRELFKNPCHPYTKALLDCLPKLDAEGQRLANIEGQPPDLGGVLPGCPFSLRCNEKRDACHADAFPPEFLVADNHYVSCWLWQ